MILVLFTDRHYDFYSDRDEFFADCVKNDWRVDDIFELIESGEKISVEHSLKSFILDKIEFEFIPLTNERHWRKRESRVTVLTLLNKMICDGLEEEEFISLKTSILNCLRLALLDSDYPVAAEQRLKEIEKYLNCFNRIF